MIEIERHAGVGAVGEQDTAGKMGLEVYIGVGLGLLGSNLCLLLLALNACDWFGLIHADLSALERLAATGRLEDFRLHFRTAAAAYAVILALCSRTTSPSDPRRPKRRRRIAFAFVSTAATLAAPRVLRPISHRHPVIRRSLVGSSARDGPTRVDDSRAEGGSAGLDVPPPVRQELVFEVDKMTCGGCGSHVRNLVEKALAAQQRDGSPFAFDKVEVDWRAGVMSVHGTQLTDHLDKDIVMQILSEDGHPTSFLYAS